MKRSTPLTRSRVRPVNRKRKAKNFQRAYGGPTRLAWLKAWVCMAHLHQLYDCAGPIEAAHTKSGGTGRKADAATLIPLCHRHHRHLHDMGARSFEKLYGFTLADACARVEAEWQKHVAARAPEDA